MILESAVQLGTLFSVAEAQKIGLVDLVVPDLQTGLNVAENKMKEFLQIPSIFSVCSFNRHIIFKKISVLGVARYMSKMLMRSDIIKKLEADRSADKFVPLTLLPEVQNFISRYLESLANKKR